MKLLIIMSCLILSRSIFSIEKDPIEFYVNPDISYRFVADSEMYDAIHFEVNFDNTTSRFEIVIITQYSDMLIGFPVFFGTFSRSGQHIYMIDIPTDAEIYAKMTNDSLVFIKSPAFLKNRKWIELKLEKRDKIYPYKIEFDASRAKNKRSELYAPYDSDIVLYDEYYLGEIASLEFTDDNKYVFKVGDFVIFIGTWSRKNNILELNEPNIQATYYMVIMGHYLWNINLPGYESAYYVSHSVEPRPALTNPYKNRHHIFQQNRETDLCDYGSNIIPL